MPREGTLTLFLFLFCQHGHVFLSSKGFFLIDLPLFAQKLLTNSYKPMTVGCTTAWFCGFASYPVVSRMDPALGLVITLFLLLTLTMGQALLTTNFLPCPPGLAALSQRKLTQFWFIQQHQKSKWCPGLQDGKLFQVLQKKEWQKLPLYIQNFDFGIVSNDFLLIKWGFFVLSYKGLISQLLGNMELFK